MPLVPLNPNDFDTFFKSRTEQLSSYEQTQVTNCQAAIQALDNASGAVEIFSCDSFYVMQRIFWALHLPLEVLVNNPTFDIVADLTQTDEGRNRILLVNWNEAHNEDNVLRIPRFNHRKIGNDFYLTMTGAF
jgi:hypothetical protein